ncbi:hypothetical protein JAAARDRAFT_382113 [Jaapia argillacea MUCL 33604]|uniref:DUF7918 domain-containing protein n=1 Tax=Jaapia argillacea MUCL 33604 TaxID=933084 RepID=A0A067Q918_9AGAM|nr:hypothetical protein JAAARDRAFT_382113 [Jaapia argillacea MUCL 33604]
MLQFGTYSSWITVGDASLEEHQVTATPNNVPSGSQVTCWVASEAGTKFTVHVANDAPYRPTAISAYLQVDGVECGVSTSSTTERALCFSTLELTDDDAYLGANNSVKGLGEISVKLYPVTVGMAIPMQPLHVPEDRKVHERTKKAGAHRVKFGEEVLKSARQNAVQVTSLSNVPCATFTFKYTSLDVLKANGIVHSEPVKSEPLPTSRKPKLESKRKRNDKESESENPKGVIANSDVSEIEISEFKRPTGVKDEPAKKKVKSERQGARRVFAEEDIIDLT